MTCTPKGAPAPGPVGETRGGTARPALDITSSWEFSKINTKNESVVKNEKQYVPKKYFFSEKKRHFTTYRGQE